MAYDPFHPSFDEIVHTYGFGIITVGDGCSVPGCCSKDDGPPWAYTIGLALEGLPEFVCTGLPSTHAHGLLTRAAKAALDGTPFPLGRHVDVDGLPLRLDALPHRQADAERIGVWWSLLGDRCPTPDLVQVVWPDRAGRFPDDPGCDPATVRAQALVARGWPHRPRQASRRRRAS